jgi:hypothetical protein
MPSALPAAECVIPLLDICIAIIFGMLDIRMPHLIMLHSVRRSLCSLYSVVKTDLLEGRSNIVARRPWNILIHAPPSLVSFFARGVVDCHLYVCVCSQSNHLAPIVDKSVGHQNGLKLDPTERRKSIALQYELKRRTHDCIVVNKICETQGDD